MEQSEKELLTLLKKGIAPATGCTEPIAVAYAVAAAKEKIKGNLQKMIIQVDSNIYKNGLMVTIPGTTRKGLVSAAAFGFVTGDAQKKLMVIAGITNEDIRKAQELIDQKRIEVILNRESTGLDIQATLLTDSDKARVNIRESHLNIVHSEATDLHHAFTPLKQTTETTHHLNHRIQAYTLKDLLRFSEETLLETFRFLQDGITMNLRIAREGLTIKSGVAATLNELIKEGTMADNLITRAQVLCAAASEARMSGSRLPVMSTAGSGNHGITVFLSNYAVAEKKNLPEERLLRALALANLITYFIKSYTGTLSAMCGCGVAAGIGASAGIVYLLGGDEQQMLGALYNMVGSISGMICDGAKDGCAYKLALASGWAVQSALLSLKGAIIHPNDGIVDPDFKQLFKNLGHVCDPGMTATDQAILDVMLNMTDGPCSERVD